MNAYIYDRQWWIQEVLDASLEIYDVYLHFYHSTGLYIIYKTSKDHLL